MHKEQPPVIRLLWANEKDLAQMPLSLRCVQYMVTISLQHQQYMFGVKSLLVVQKVLSLRNNLHGRCVVSTTDATIAAIDSLVRSNRRLME